MENLKSVVADKILNLKTNDGSDVKQSVEKIQRFMDFANACQTFINKYPKIEEELIKMVKSDDFDTKVASARVDSIIRLAEYGDSPVETDMNSPLEEIQTDSEASVSEENGTSVSITPVDENQNTAIDYDDYHTVNGETYISSEIIPIDVDQKSEEEIKTENRKILFKRILQVTGLVLVIILVIYIIKFIIANWVAVVSVVGGLALIALIIFILKNKKN